MLDLPYSATYGEILPLKVVLYNYHEHSLDITLVILESSDFAIIGKPESNISTVDTQELKMAIFMIEPKKVGEIVITVQGLNFEFNDAVQRNLIVEAPGGHEIFPNVK